MRNLLLFITILAMFLNFSNAAFAQDYDATSYIPEMLEVENQKQPNKFKRTINYVKEGGQKIKQQYIYRNISSTTNSKYKI